MATPPLLDIDPGHPPVDFAAETPCPMLGVDPVDKQLTQRQRLVLSRIDGMTTLGELFDASPVPPAELLAALVRLHADGLIGFAPEFEAKYLGPPPPAASPAAPAVPSVAPPQPLAPVRISRATPAPEPIRPATFSIPPPATIPPPLDQAQAPPPTEELTRERRGELALRPLARLARNLVAARYTGVVTLRRERVAKRILFALGDPVNAESDDPAEELGPLMHGRGKIDDRVFGAYQRLRREGREPPAALLELGAVAAADLARADRWRAQAVLYDALLWRQGSYELGEPGRFPAEASRYDLGLPNLVLKAWREAPFDDARRKFFEEHRNWYLVPGPISDETLGRLRLNPKEERLLESVREQARRVRDVMELTPLFIGETYRFMDGLLAMGLAELSEKNPTETGPVEIKELPGLFQAMRDGNFFDRLSAHPVSTDQDVEDARQRMLARFDPRWYSNLLPETRQRLEQMKAMIEEAYEHLRDGTRRKEYRKTQYDRGRLEYFAEIQFRKGEIFLFWREDAPTALAILESAYEMCPDLPLYGASYALAIVRAYPADRERRAEARRLVERAIGRANPQPRVLVVAGATVRMLGDVPRSEQLFAAALKGSGNAPEIAQLVDQMRKRTQQK
jgi:tetratricopeptide (TPR) repeat protein